MNECVCVVEPGFIFKFVGFLIQFFFFLIIFSLIIHDKTESTEQGDYMLILGIRKKLHEGGSICIRLRG